MANFKNRIIGYGEEPIDQILFNPSNWRIHPKNQQDALTGVLEEVGWVQNVIVNKRTGHLVDGHLRVQLADRAGEKTIPVTYVDLSESEEMTVLATIDPIAALAATDKEKLDEVLRGVHADDVRVQKAIADLAAKEGLYPADAGKDTEPQIDKAEELRVKWGVETGQLWKLGDHRLICGDCTDKAVIERLLGGIKAEMMFTDPPYGVAYDGGHFHSGDVNIKRAREKLEADDSAEIYTKFLPAVLSFVDGPCYMWFASTKAFDVFGALHDNNCETHAMIIWNKINATYAAMNAQYKQRHEPCIYFKRKGSTLRWCGPTDECTIWEIKRDARNEYHPTQKPIELVERAIKNHEATIIIDCFSGSGTTIISCENLNRKCRAIEISPGYVAVALERWHQHTGLMPELIR